MCNEKSREVVLEVGWKWGILIPYPEAEWVFSPEGMKLEGRENPFCRGIGVRITFSYSKADLWPGKTFQYMFFQPTCVEVGWKNLYWNPFSALPLARWAGKTYTEIQSLPSFLWGGLEKLILKSILCPVHEEGRKERGAALSPSLLPVWIRYISWPPLISQNQPCYMRMVGRLAMRNFRGEVTELCHEHTVLHYQLNRQPTIYQGMLLSAHMPPISLCSFILPSPVQPSHLLGRSCSSALRWLTNSVCYTVTTTEPLFRN